MLLTCVLVIFLSSAQILAQARNSENEDTFVYTENYDPMNSRFAPRENNRQYGLGFPYVITEARLKEIRKPLMYPYYDKGDNADYQIDIQISTPQVHKNLNFQLPFFGFRFNYTRVSLNGYLEFSDPPQNYGAYPLVFPIKDWPKKNDPSFIGIFYSKCRVGNLRDEDIDQRAPGVYFRMERDLRGRLDRMGVEIRERLKWDIREGIIGAESFNPKHAIIVTWKNVSFAGGYANANYRTNTFQLVLATDEVYTYAMFNYLNLDWTSHTEAGGDTIQGEGGIPAFVGFNAGNGTKSYEYQPFSQASVIRDLSRTGFGNDKKGRHLFRIDENIMLGSCNKDIDGANLNLVFAPESGNMLGGTIVNITGPCFKPNDQWICKFGSAEEVYAVVVSSNRAICVQPPLLDEGYVELMIKKVGTWNYKWKGKYHVETPATATQKFFFDDMAYNEKSPSEIGITWEKQNLTTNEDAAISMSLWGYRETPTERHFLYIADLAVVQNVGFYKIVPSLYRNRSDEFFNDVQFGFIQLNFTRSIVDEQGVAKATITPLIWSRPIPLGWYFGPQWKRKYGENWAKSLCDNWLNYDRHLKNFNSQLPQCPCTLDQALADKGRFLPDLDCDKDFNPKCYFHLRAVHCVKSATPTPQGAEQQCCYDKNFYLMLTHDQKWGSYPRRSHNLAILPWHESTPVPTLSQWHNDIVPRFACCLWQEESSEGCEALRIERRPTQDCVGYKAPGIAGVYGHPHIITFDELRYTFNGHGEFVLVRSMNVSNRLEIQGRFEQVPKNAYGEVRATQLTSVVARGNSTTVIEVKTRPREARWRYRLDVLVDEKRVYFDTQSLKFQHFPGAIVYVPSYIFDQSEVIIMFDSGAGLQVVERNGYLAATAYLPPSLTNHTRGLFGSWNSNILDDFTLPDGTRIGVSPNLDHMGLIYRDFGIKWMVDDVEDSLKGSSLFQRQFGKTASTYNNKSFQPEFSRIVENLIPANRSVYLIRAYGICTDLDHDCLYDYAMTYSKEVAQFTVDSKRSILSLKKTNWLNVMSCGALKTPRFARKDTFLFVSGTKVTFECAESFVLVGERTRVCLPNGEWIPQGGNTECPRLDTYVKFVRLGQSEYLIRQSRADLLTVPVLLVLVFVFVAFMVFMRRQKRINGEERSFVQFHKIQDTDDGESYSDSGTKELT